MQLLVYAMFVGFSAFVIGLTLRLLTMAALSGNAQRLSKTCEMAELHNRIVLLNHDLRGEPE